MPANIPALTGIRGYAALWVVVMHYTWGAGNGGDSWFYRIALNGFGGVIIFLVLSGFVLTHVYRAEFSQRLSARGYGAYLHNRLARIYPLHILTLLVFVALAYLGIQPSGENETAYTFALNLLLIHAWGFVNDFSWNMLSWTISVEMFAYLWLLPLLVAVLFNLPRTFSAIAVVAAVLIVWADPLPRLLVKAGVDITGLQLGFGYFLFVFSFVFAAGVALYRVVQNGVTQSVGTALVLTGLGVILYACTVPLQNWLMMVGAVFLVAGLIPDNGLGRMLFGNRPSVFLGDVSYALYLTHMLLNSVITYFAPGTGLAARLVAAILVAAVVHYAFERPARAYLRGLWQSRRYGFA